VVVGTVMNAVVAAEVEAFVVLEKRVDKVPFVSTCFA